MQQDMQDTRAVYEQEVAELRAFKARFDTAVKNQDEEMEKAKMSDTSSTSDTQSDASATSEYSASTESTAGKHVHKKLKADQNPTDIPLPASTPASRAASPERSMDDASI